MYISRDHPCFYCLFVFNFKYYLIITLSFGSIEIDRVISETVV